MMARVHLHRFRDCAGLSITGASGTVYLDAATTRRVARDFMRLARSLERESFTESEYRAAPAPGQSGPLPHGQTMTTQPQRSHNMTADISRGAAAQYAKAPVERGQK